MGGLLRCLPPIIPSNAAIQCVNRHLSNWLTHCEFSAEAMSDPQARFPASRGRTLKLYLVDGTPSGVITAELGVSSVRAAVATRTALPELIRRDEATGTGIYLLVGPDPDSSGRQLVYVGEGDQVKTRLATHDSDLTKEFFTRAVLIVSKDENLTKAHARYLESRVIAAIRDAGRAKLVNGTEPPFRGLPEPEIADMERVLDEIEVLLPVLGFDILRSIGKDFDQAKVITAKMAKSPDLPMVAGDQFEFTEAGTLAKARESSGEFVVLAGSTARRMETPSCPEGAKRRRAQLLADATLVPTDVDGFLRFTADTSFDTPSGAGGVVSGASVNGRTSWRHASTGQSYAVWRSKKIADSANS